MAGSNFVMTTLSPLNEVEVTNVTDLNDLHSGYCGYTNDTISWGSLVILLFTILGLTANGCLIFVILRRHYLRNLTNTLVVNLTVSDIILFVTTVPFFIEGDLHPCWQFGTAVCKLGNTIWVVSHSVCMFTLAALAVERYCAVTSRAGFRSKTCALMSIWVLAVLLSIPVFVTAHMPYEGVCIGMSRNWIFVQVYITCHVIFTFVIPLAIIAFFYVKMARTLLQDRSGSKEVNKAIDKGYRKRRRLAAIVLVLVLIFAIFWTPFHIFNLFVVYGPYWQVPWVLIILHYVSIYVYLFLNPLVVFFMSSSLRRELVSCRRGAPREQRDLGSQSDISDVDLELQQPINEEPDD